MTTPKRVFFRPRRAVPGHVTFLGVLALLFAAGCGGDGGSSEPKVLRINSINANPSSVFPGGTTTLSCDATDPEGDPLTYTWSAPSGAFPAGKDRAIVQWVAPGVAGNVDITVTVTDGTDTVTASITVEVTVSATGLQIVGLTANPSMVVPGGDVELFCDARDSDGRAISYWWETSDGGFFVGGAHESATVQWTAPGDTTDAYLRVFVRAGGDQRVGTLVVRVRPNAPVLDTDPHYLDYPSDVSARTLVVHNAGGTSLNWTAAPDSSWVTVSVASGALVPDESVTLTVTVNRTGLPSGVLGASVMLNSEGGIFRVPLAVTVLPQAALVVDPVSLDFGTTETSQAFTIHNAGIGTLNWTAHPDTSRGLWVSVAPPLSGSLGAGGSHVLMVNVDRGGLATGEHIGAVRVESDGGLADVGIRAEVP